MKYRVTATQDGNRIELGAIDAKTAREALNVARQMANKAFDYIGIGSRPTVNLKLIDETITC